MPKNAFVVDATGKFLISGLWDMHVHTFYEGVSDINFPLLIANGVTGVRDMNGDFPLFAEYLFVYPSVNDLKSRIP